MNEKRKDVSWSAMEIRPEAKPLLDPLCEPGMVMIGDTVKMCGDDEGRPWRLAPPHPLLAPYEVVISNPPFSLALDFAIYLLRGMRPGAILIMLLRLNWLGSSGRADFFTSSFPDCFILPDRPNFDGEGTDSAEYAWMRWRVGHYQSAGSIQRLGLTPAHEKLPGKMLLAPPPKAQQGFDFSAPVTDEDIDAVADRLAGTNREPS